MNQGEFEESLRETKNGLVGLKGEYLFQYVRGPLGALPVALLDPVRGTMTQRRRQKESTDLYLLRDLDRKNFLTNRLSCGVQIQLLKKYSFLWFWLALFVLISFV